MKKKKLYLKLFQKKNLNKKQINKKSFYTVKNHY